MGDSHDDWHGAEAQATAIVVDFGPLTLQVDIRFAPVNLNGLTWIEAQGNKGFCRLILKVFDIMPDS